MGGAQAAKTLLTIKVAQLERSGEKLTPEQQNTLLADIQKRYDSTTTPVYAASRLWVDGIIAPTETRTMISRGIAVASHQGSLPELRTGVFQV
jgi:acetyl-CoA carboxylase carboxyltransferase component